MDARRRHRRVNIRTEVLCGEEGIFTRGNELLNDFSVG